MSTRSPLPSKVRIECRRHAGALARLYLRPACSASQANRCLFPKRGPVKRQTKAIFRTLAGEASALGASVENTLGLQQYITSCDLAPFYSEERRQHFPKGAPTSTSIACSKLGAPDALVQVDAILRYSGCATRDKAGDRHASHGGYAHTIGFGDWVFCSGVLASAVPSGAAYEGGPGTSVAKEARSIPITGSVSPSSRKSIISSLKKLAAVLEKVRHEPRKYRFCPHSFARPGPRSRPFHRNLVEGVPAGGNGHLGRARLWRARRMHRGHNDRDKQRRQPKAGANRCTDFASL